MISIDFPQITIPDKNTIIWQLINLTIIELLN